MVSFAAEFAAGLQQARENHEREESRKNAQKNTEAQLQIAKNQFDLQSFLASLAAGKDMASAQQGKVHEANDQGVVSAPNLGSSSAQGGTFEVSGGVPTITPPAPVTVKGRPNLGIGDVSLPVQSVEEIARNKSAAQQSENANSIDLFKKQQDIRDQNENITVGPDSPLIKHGLTPGVYKPQEITAYTNLEIAEEARKARVQAATQAAIAHGDTQKALQVQRDFQRASGIRDDYKGEIAYKQYATVLPQVSIVQDSMKSHSAAGDKALIYGYMKLLDPGSSVKDAEFKLAAKTGSLPEKVKAVANTIINGEMLTDEIRKDFAQSSMTIFKSYQREKSSLDKIYAERASRAKVNPEDVVTPDSDLGATEAAAPQVPVQTAPSGATFSFRSH